MSDTKGVPIGDRNTEFPPNRRIIQKDLGVSFEKNTEPIKPVETGPFSGVALFSGTNISEGTCTEPVWRL